MSLRVQYARPRSLDQAAELLGGLTSGAVIIAGGQELMPHLNYGRLAPSVLVDISNLSELRGIQATDSGVAIGALCVHRDIQHDALVSERAPLLAFAASQVGGGWQVRAGQDPVELLPEADRRIIHLRHFAGLSFKQIAEVLEQPLGTVLARQHRALKKLRGLMSEVEGEGEDPDPADRGTT